MEPTHWEFDELIDRHDELQLAWRLLKRTIGGQGSVLLLAGEAGAGKSKLLSHFAHEASQAFPELVVARGEGNAHVGSADAYLPWKEVLWDLTREEGHQSQEIAKIALKLVHDVGPDLIGTFLPGAGPALKGLQSVFARFGFQTRLVHEDSSSLDQSRLFEEYWQVLERLSEARPLLILIDDLHWIDESSTGLLFYLGRKIQTARILLVCTYRKHELASEGRDQARGVNLRRVINELRRYGASLLELDWQANGEAEEKKHIFVQDYVDAAFPANTFPDDFVTSLVDRTGANPLFLSELLGLLVDDERIINEDGVWRLSGEIPLSGELPEKLEAVVEERIARLTQDLKLLLTDASVEGEGFTAEVLAKLHDMDERSVLGRLVGELSRTYHLVEEGGERKITRTRIVSLFRFRHRIMRDHLYGTLSESERRLLHRQVGECLEALYDDATSMIALQLARHFECAQDVFKAASYYEQAGDTAWSSLASAEALEAYRRGISVFNEDGEESETDVQLMKGRLLRKAGDVSTYRGYLEEARAYYEQALSLAETAESRERYLVLDGLGDVCRDAGQYSEAESYYKEVESNLGPEDTTLKAEVLCDLSDLYDDILYFDAQRLKQEGEVTELDRIRREGRQCAEQAIEVSEEHGLWRHASRAHLAMSWLAMREDKLQDAIDSAGRSLEIAKKHGGNRNALNTLGECHRRLGEFDRAQNYYEKYLDWAERTGSIRMELVAWHNLGIVSYDRGDVHKAQNYFDRSLGLQEISPYPGAEIETRIMKGLVALRREDSEEGIVQFRSALQVAGLLESQDRDVDLVEKVVEDLLTRGEMAKAQEVIDVTVAAGFAVEALRSQILNS